MRPLQAGRQERHRSRTAHDRIAKQKKNICKIVNSYFLVFASYNDLEPLFNDR